MAAEVRVPAKEQIEKRAYELYLARGCEPGKELDDWLAAEAELKLEMDGQQRTKTRWTASAAASQPGA